MRCGADIVDLIIVDIFMDEMDGIDFMKSIRTFSYDIPIIIISAHTDKVPIKEISKFNKT